MNLFKDYAIEQFVFQLLFGRPDMDDKLLELGVTRAQLRKLQYDDEIAAAIETRREAVIATPWHLEPYSSRNHKFIWNEIEPHILAVLRSAWNAVPYGYSVQEVVYRTTPEGRIGIASVVEKPMEWFRPEYDGTLYYDHPLEGTVAVDTAVKFLLTVRESSYRNPRGEALFSRLYSAWFLRTHGWRYWIQFLERVGIPFLIGTTEGDVEDMLARLKDAVQNATIAVGGGEKVEFMTGTSGGSPFEAFEDRLERRIQKLILGQTGTTDVSNSGSYAAAKVQEHVKDDRRNSDIRLCMATAQKLVNALWVLNKFPGDIPTFKQEDGTGLQPERADRDSKLITAGIVKRYSLDYLIRSYDFEKGDIEIPDETMQNTPPTDPQQSAQDSGTPKDNTQAGDTTDGESFSASTATPKQQVIEGIVDGLLEREGQAISPEALYSAIRGATGPEDLDERLAVLLAGISRDKRTEIRERALFSADLIGYAHASQP